MPATRPKNGLADEPQLDTGLPAAALLSYLPLSAQRGDGPDWARCCRTASQPQRQQSGEKLTVVAVANTFRCLLQD